MWFRERRPEKTCLSQWSVPFSPADVVHKPMMSPDFQFTLKQVLCQAVLFTKLLSTQGNRLIELSWHKLSFSKSCNQLFKSNVCGIAYATVVTPITFPGEKKIHFNILNMNSLYTFAAFSSELYN